MTKLILIPVILMLNAIIGAFVCAILDAEDEVFYKWYSACPFPVFGHFILLNLWPLIAIFMLKYRMDQKKND